MHRQTQRQKLYVGADAPLRGPSFIILRQRVDYTEHGRHIASVDPSSFDRCVLAKLPDKRRYTKMNVTRLAVNCKTQATRQCNLNYHIARVYMSESMPSMAARKRHICTRGDSEDHARDAEIVSHVCTAAGARDGRSRFRGLLLTQESLLTGITEHDPLHDFHGHLICPITILEGNIEGNEGKQFKNYLP